jgi:hypothetical protein
MQREGGNVLGVTGVVLRLDEACPSFGLVNDAERRFQPNASPWTPVPLRIPWYRRRK